MKNILLILCVFAYLNNYSQTVDNDAHITISTAINQEKQEIKEIIATMRDFLETKNDSLTYNKHWLPADFEKYAYPYLDLFDMENGNDGNNIYQPSIMEIIPTDNSSQWIVKLAFIRHNPSTKDNLIRSIYNILATKTNDEIILSKYQDHLLESWQQQSIGSLNYYISPLKKINEQEIAQQLKDIEKLCAFFETDPIPITYISCINPQEVFQVKGFDYNPMMFVSKTGGLAEYGNIIFSGNNSEIYTHEIIHIYTMNLFPYKHSFFDEGLATYLSGSGIYKYDWHKEKLKRFLVQNPTFEIKNHMEDLYERLYFEEETSIPYLIAAVVCDYIIETHGKQKYFELLNSRNNLGDSLDKVGLNKENVNMKIRKKLGI